LKKNSKVFSQEGPHENVWRPHMNVSLGTTVALDGPGSHIAHDTPQRCLWFPIKTFNL